MKRFFIRETGEVMTLEDLDPIDFIETERTRVSTIEPVDRVLLVAFKFVRLFGARATEWTRSWVCEWQLHVGDIFICKSMSRPFLINLEKRIISINRF